MYHNLLPSGVACVAGGLLKGRRGGGGGGRNSRELLDLLDPAPYGARVKGETGKKTKKEVRGGGGKKNAEKGLFPTPSPSIFLLSPIFSFKIVQHGARNRIFPPSLNMLKTASNAG